MQWEGAPQRGGHDCEVGAVVDVDVVVDVDFDVDVDVDVDLGVVQGGDCATTLQLLD